jgi:putative inorganic carbon (HCO3(-)) transporter
MENRLSLYSGASSAAPTVGNQRFSFAALYVFTLLLYSRPQELFPSVFGDFPLVKIVAIAALATFVLGRLTRGEPVTAMPIELKMLGVILALSLIFAPFAQAPGDSFKVLSDTLLKIVAVFVLMINLLDTKERLISVLRLVVWICTFMALAACVSYLTGRFTPKSDPPRIAGIVNGFFGNPNDLATSLDLVIPLAVTLGMFERGNKRLLYFLCAFVLGLAVIVTFSRGGFLGLIAIGIFFVWKLARRRAGTTALIVVSVLALLILAPGGYSSRLSSILHSDEDQTGSAQARLELLTRASEIAVTHPIVGIGLGNFHIYSIQEQRAHNSYLEIAAELGLVGLAAYLIILFGPFRYLRRIEKASRPSESAPFQPGWDRFATRKPDPTLGAGALGDTEMFYLSIGIQGALLAYAVCSFFGSVQYIWDLYYVVAYAIALKGISQITSKPRSDTKVKAGSRSGPGTVRVVSGQASPQAGVLWG